MKWLQSSQEHLAPSSTTNCHCRVVYKVWRFSLQTASAFRVTHLDVIPLCRWYSLPKKELSENKYMSTWMRRVQDNLFFVFKRHNVESSPEDNWYHKWKVRAGSNWLASLSHTGIHTQQATETALKSWGFSFAISFPLPRCGANEKLTETACKFLVEVIVCVSLERGLDRILQFFSLLPLSFKQRRLRSYYFLAKAPGRIAAVLESSSWRLGEVSPDHSWLETSSHTHSRYSLSWPAPGSATDGSSPQVN